jgi:multiple sugar transport system permease protein
VANQSISVPMEKAVAPGWWAQWRENWAENRLAYILLFPSAAAYIIFLFYPIVNMMLSSFSTVDTIGRVTSFGTLENYRTLWADPNLPMIMGHTVWYAFGSVVLTVLLAFPLAMILNTNFPGQTIAKALILIPWAMPFAVSAITWRWIFNGQMGALNYLLSQLGLIKEYIVWLGDPTLAFGAALFVEVWTSVPFMAFTILAGLQAIPPSIYDAAKMDGASPWREFLDMTVPQMRNVLMVVTLLSLIWAFRSFGVIWILTKGDPVYRTDIAVTYLYKVAFENLHFGVGYALAVCLFVIMIIFSILYTRLSEEA